MFLCGKEAFYSIHWRFLWSCVSCCSSHTGLDHGCKENASLAIFLIIGCSWNGLGMHWWLADWSHGWIELKTIISRFFRSSSICFRGSIARRLFSMLAIMTYMVCPYNRNAQNLHSRRAMLPRTRSGAMLPALQWKYGNMPIKTYLFALFCCMFPYAACGRSNVLGW